MVGASILMLSTWWIDTSTPLMAHPTHSPLSTHALCYKTFCNINYIVSPTLINSRRERERKRERALVKLSRAFNLPFPTPAHLSFSASFFAGGVTKRPLPRPPLRGVKASVSPGEWPGECRRTRPLRGCITYVASINKERMVGRPLCCPLRWFRVG